VRESKKGEGKKRETGKKKKGETWRREPDHIFKRELVLAERGKASGEKEERSEMRRIPKKKEGKGLLYLTSYKKKVNAS